MKETMPYEEDRFETHDGLWLNENRWLPEGDPAAVVVVVHGFIEHSGRYAELAQRFNQEGYAVYAMDIRGHGKSEGERVFIRSFDDLLADLERFLDRVGAHEANKPMFLFGHSMGGTVVALLAAMRPPDVRGLVLSAPACRIGNRVFPLLRRLAGFFSRVLPKLRLVPMSVKSLSRDREVVDQFHRDPLVFHGRFPVRTGAEILHAADRVEGQMEAIRLPFLVLHGTGDAVADPEGSRLLYQRAGSTDKTLKLYDGLYHDLFHEPEKEQLTADVIEWLGARRS